MAATVMKNMLSQRLGVPASYMTVNEGLTKQGIFVKDLK